jgi:hypothetical protein
MQSGHVRSEQKAFSGRKVAQSDWPNQLCRRQSENHRFVFRAAEKAKKTLRRAKTMRS